MSQKQNAQKQNAPLSRRWTWTLNNYTEEEMAALATMDCTYTIYQKETCPSTGTPHLQGYTIFKVNKRLSAVKKINARIHWEVSKYDSAHNIAYCSKTEDGGSGEPIEHGTRPKTKKEQGEDSKRKWADVIRSAKEGTAEDEYPQEFVQYNSTLTRMYQPTLTAMDTYTGLWFYGPPGSGKSRKARHDYPFLYDKLLNKWWDNYEGEETVLIDDIDTSHTYMGLFLKRYADHYPFRAEYKGGSKTIRPARIVVTSNYTIEEIFGYETQMTKAIQRRYKTENFHADYPWTPPVE